MVARLAVVWNFVKNVLLLRFGGLPWWHLACSVQYKVRQAVHQVSCPMVKGGFGFSQCPAGSVAATSSVPGSVTWLIGVLEIICIKWSSLKS